MIIISADDSLSTGKLHRINFSTTGIFRVNSCKQAASTAFILFFYMALFLLLLID